MSSRATSGPHKRIPTSTSQYRRWQLHPWPNAHSGSTMPMRASNSRQNGISFFTLGGGGGGAGLDCSKSTVRHVGQALTCVFQTLLHFGWSLRTNISLTLATFFHRRNRFRTQFMTKWTSSSFGSSASTTLLRSLSNCPCCKRVRTRLNRFSTGSQLLTNCLWSLPHSMQATKLSRNSCAASEAAGVIMPTGSVCEPKCPKSDRMHQVQQGCPVQGRSLGHLKEVRVPRSTEV
mmetsp:Transcript_5184/g.11466  ORF Transcript_5184/g.11466 Transcript_5184/m.11466 type:complete len:233 (-) Transcript_5184:7-705(-)